MIGTDAVNRLAANWLRKQGYLVREVLSMQGYGTDWAGSTEDGFGSTFDVTLRFADEQGDTHATVVEGELLQSLWEFVVNHDNLPDSE